MMAFFSNFLAGSSLLLLLSDFLVTPVSAQGSRIFQWQFSQQISDSLPSCFDLPITIKPYDSSGTSLGVAPYYMVSYELNGTPKVTLLGQNVTSLKWAATHPVGTRLALSVIDSNGTAGGIPPSVYTVVAGQSTSCISGSNSSDFTVSANITAPQTVNTCEPWGLRIKGGVKPYNVTFLQINSPVVTNTTMGPPDDGFTYINRATPGSMLIAAVSDFTGKYAYGTPSVNPVGSTNVDCTGLVSRSGNAAQLDQQAADSRAQEAADKKHHRTAIIAGIVVPLTLLALAGIGAFWYLRYHKPRKNGGRDIDLTSQNTSVKPYETGMPGQVLTINNFIDNSAASTPRSPKTPPSINTSGPPGIHHSVSFMSSHYTSSSAPAFDPYSTTDSSTVGRPTSAGSHAGRPGFTNFPVRRSAKAVEAGYAQDHNNTYPPSDANAPSSSSSYADGSRVAPTRTTSVGRNATGEPELIIQHRDGGPGRVRELPPPYADRGEDDS